MLYRPSFQSPLSTVHLSVDAVPSQFPFSIVPLFHCLSFPFPSTLYRPPFHSLLYPLSIVPFAVPLSVLSIVHRSLFRRCFTVPLFSDRRPPCTSFPLPSPFPLTVAPLSIVPFTVPLSSLHHPLVLCPSFPLPSPFPLSIIPLSSVHRSLYRSPFL